MPRYINPDAPMKSCPEPGCTNKIYSGHMSIHNPKHDGRQMCSDCVVHHMYEKFFEKKD